MFFKGRGGMAKNDFEAGLKIFFHIFWAVIDCDPSLGTPGRLCGLLFRMSSIDKFGAVC